MPTDIISPLNRHRAPISPYTCGHCPAQWSGVAMAHCSACHRTFSTSNGFDRHRLRGACADPAERGLLLDPIGIWRLPPQAGGHWAARLRAGT